MDQEINKNENIETQETELQQVQAKLKETEEKLKRIAADSQNAIKRSQTEIEDARKYSSSKLAQKIISSIDMLKLAVEHTKKEEIEKNQELKNLYQGLTMSLKEIEKALEENKITKLGTKTGDKFDFHLHNAISTQKSKLEKGLICEVIKDGYKIHDRILSHAIVKVSDGE